MSRSTISKSAPGFGTCTAFIFCMAVSPLSTAEDLTLACDRRNDLLGAHNGTGIVWNIDVEGNLHFSLRVIRDRVPYHRDLVTKLGRKSHGRLYARVGDQPDDDELVNTMLLEQQIQIGVGKAAGAPMFLGHDIA